MQPAQILKIADASDGTGIGPPVSKKAYHDDSFYLEKIAEKWAKDRGLPSGVKYMLDRLPTGFVGYASAREQDPKHIDRYLYGHPNGHFRSMNELYPHFIQLQTFGGTVGCPCKLCTGKKPVRAKRNSGSNSGDNSLLSSSPGEQSRFVAPPPPPKIPGQAQAPSLKKRSSNNDDLPQGRLPSNSPSPSSKRRKPNDDEGTPDLYRSLVDELRTAGEDGVQKEVTEQMSPDWRAGHDMLQALLSEWSDKPSFVPRIGELVLFARTILEDDVAWDTSTQSLRRVDSQSKAWLERLQWEVGVVTQMPTEPLSKDDLIRIPAGMKKSIAYSGFRIEPLSQPASESKHYTKQHKYVPLHAIRPFSFWKECMSSIDENEWHPTLKHALTVASSFCIIGRYSFKGVWPEAAVFTRGVYIGSELVMVGDTVRLMPKSDSKSITEVLTITSIRLRFVKLDQLDFNDNLTSCLHFTGKAFSLDPKRSHGGIAVAPATPGEDGLPAELAGYGRWFHITDPKDAKARLEVPFSRILGRYIEHDAVKSWFRTPNDMPPPPSSFQAVNSSSSSTTSTKVRPLDFSQGLASTREARKYSLAHDSRIDKSLGKTWFWAESRIEQLDLHEVNGRFVGVKDEKRTPKQLNEWRAALKLLDGKKGGFEHYQAALKQRQDEQKNQASTSAFGLMGAATQMDSAEDGEKTGADENQDEGEDVEIDSGGGGNDMLRAGASAAVDLVSDDDIMMVDE